MVPLAAMSVVTVTFVVCLLCVQRARKIVMVLKSGKVIGYKRELGGMLHLSTHKEKMCLTYEKKLAPRGW